MIILYVKVWWDVKCLKAGEQWEDGFCNGLVKSMIFLPIISRGAVNHPTSPRQSFEVLSNDSPCDNVFLEHRLALELRERGLVEKIFPLFFGDLNEEGMYSRYSFSGNYPCHPVCTDAVIESVEAKVRTNLDKQGQGMPFFESQTVMEVMTELTCYQGAFIEGDLAASMGAAVEMVMEMLESESSPRAHKHRSATSFRNDYIPPNTSLSPPKCVKMPPDTPESPSTPGPKKRSFKMPLPLDLSECTLNPSTSSPSLSLSLSLSRHPSGSIPHLTMP